MREFGVRDPSAIYIPRPSSYALIRRADGCFAFVEGQETKLYLPGGGVETGESPKAALLREIAEEIGWEAQLGAVVSRAKQYLFAPGEGHVVLASRYFTARLTAPRPTAGEHALLWLHPAAAVPRLARESDIWVLSQIS